MTPCVRFFGAIAAVTTITLILLLAESREYGVMAHTELIAIRGGEDTPACESSDHDFCPPNEATCSSTQCSATTTMCPDPSDPGNEYQITGVYCGYAESHFERETQWYPICVEYGFNGYRGKVIGTTNCGYSVLCNSSGPTCDQPWGGCKLDQIGGAYWCVTQTGAEVDWPNCTPDRNKEICAVQGGRLPVPRRLIVLAATNGLFYQLHFLRISDGHAAS